jgi:hypothetical protein
MWRAQEFLFLSRCLKRVSQRQPVRRVGTQISRHPPSLVGRKPIPPFAPVPRGIHLDAAKLCHEREGARVFMNAPRRDQTAETVGQTPAVHARRNGAATRCGASVPLSQQPESESTSFNGGYSLGKGQGPYLFDRSPLLPIARQPMVAEIASALFLSRG